MDNNNNLDLNKMLDMLSKMDKNELESKLKQAQAIMNSKNIDTSNFGK